VRVYPAHPGRPVFISLLPPTSPSTFYLLPIALAARDRRPRASTPFVHAASSSTVSLPISLPFPVAPLLLPQPLLAASVARRARPQSRPPLPARQPAPTCATSPLPPGSARSLAPGAAARGARVAPSRPARCARPPALGPRRSHAAGTASSAPARSLLPRAMPRRDGAPARPCTRRDVPCPARLPLAHPVSVRLGPSLAMASDRGMPLPGAASPAPPRLALPRRGSPTRPCPCPGAAEARPPRSPPLLAAQRGVPPPGAAAQPRPPSRRGLASARPDFAPQRGRGLELDQCTARGFGPGVAPLPARGARHGAARAQLGPGESRLEGG
jgi:hypothetical protein